MTKKALLTITAILLFAAGYFFRSWTHTCPDPAAHTCPVKIEYRDRVQTEIAYVPKETVIYKTITGETVTGTEATDVDVNIGKQELAVKVNGKDFAITKADDEQYIFDKNKLQLTQTSRADLQITVPTVDKTKRWEIGIGASKDGAVGLVGFPIRGNVGGWIAGRHGDIMAGVTIKI